MVMTDSASAPVPDATILTLLHLLGIQAMVALGEVISPITQQKTVNLRQAQWHIAGIEVLQEKTAGNLTEAEETAIEKVLVELREVLARKKARKAV